VNRTRLPAHLVPAYEPAAIRERITELAAELDPWAAAVRARTGHQLLALCVLRGGVFFFSDLLQAMHESVEPAFCRCHAYAKGLNNAAATALQVALADPVASRAVLLVDNICDSGRTLAELDRRCRELGATEVRAAVLIHRLRDDSRFTPEHVGFKYPGPEWFAGYGLRDGDVAMNFPTVFRVIPANATAP
jgi:hypoxanthine phosphoribosyltransferase